ncbi:unnamed protein product, partial [Symbiodinium pilosum]
MASCKAESQWPLALQLFSSMASARLGHDLSGYNAVLNATYHTAPGYQLFLEAVQ